MVKRYQHRDFLDNEPLASERVVVFVFRLYPDPLIPLDQRGLVDETLFLGSAGGQSTCVSYKTCVFGLLSPKTTQYQVNQDRIILSWFLVTGAVLASYNGLGRILSSFILEKIVQNWYYFFL